MKGFIAVPITAIVGVSLAFAGVASPAIAQENADAPQSKVTVLTMTDFHGYLGQVPNMMCQVNSIRDANPGNVLLASNGDNVGGSAYISAVNDDLPTLEMLNAMQLDVTSVGNHELDRGTADLTGRLQDKSDFPYVAANIEGLDPAIVPPYVIKRTDNGVDVAFVGAAPEDLPTLVDPNGIAGLSITDPVAAVDKVAAELKDGDDANGEADVVVALIHDDYKIAAGVGADVDVVVAGHSHVEYSGETASGAPVVQPGYFGNLIGQIDLDIDADGKVVSAAASMLSVKKVADADCAAEPFKSMYEEYQAQADELGKEPVGSIEGKARRATNFGFDSSEQGNENRGTESSAGNLIAQSFYEFSQMNGFGADFGLINSGGVRADLDADGDGVITRGEAQSTQPFDGDMGTVDLTAKQVYELLEQQWKGEEASRPVLQLGLSDTIAYTYDPEAPIGSKVTSVRIHGELLDRNDESRTYRVIAGTFLLAGGDGFTALAEGANFKNLGYKDLAATVEFLKAKPGWKVSNSQRSIGVGALPAFTQGADVTVNLSSLSMTADEEKPATASISLADGTVLGTADVDNTIVPQLPETGRAAVTFTVPADLAPGKHVIVIKAGETEYPLTIEVVGSDAGATEEPGATAEPGPTAESGTDATAAPGSPAPTADGQGKGKDAAGGQLATTGAADQSLVVMMAVLLLAAGAALVAAKRREMQ